jgi:hypothetical protein
LVLAGQRLLWVTTDGKLRMCDVNTWALRDLAEGVKPQPSTVVLGERVMCFGEGGLLAIDLSARRPRPRQWADTSWLGEPTSPMLAAESGIYVAMDGWGLVRLGAGR